MKFLMGLLAIMLTATLAHSNDAFRFCTVDLKPLYWQDKCRIECKDGNGALLKRISLEADAKNIAACMTRQTGRGHGYYKCPSKHGEGYHLTTDKNAAGMIYFTSP